MCDADLRRSDFFDQVFGFIVASIPDEKGLGIRGVRGVMIGEIAGHGIAHGTEAYPADLDGMCAGCCWAREGDIVGVARGDGDEPVGHGEGRRVVLKEEK